MSSLPNAIVMKYGATHAFILTSLHLLRQAHQDHIRALAYPFCVELLFCLCPYSVVRSLQSLQQLLECRVHFLG